MPEDKNVNEIPENNPSPIETNEVWSEVKPEGDAELERIAEEMDTPAKKYARWPQNKRDMFERIVGLALGVLSGSSLMFIRSESTSFLSLSVVLALVLAMVVPRILENKLQARMKLLRKYMLIALAAFIAGMLIFVLASGAALL